MLALTLSPEELRTLTGYRQPSQQLAELKRQGFYRARRDRLGRVVLERDHYTAVCAGQAQPANQPTLRPPRLRAV
jgi:hypothetical protein